MYTNNTINKIKKIGILLSLIVGFMLITSTDVSAQYGNNGYSRRDNRSYNGNYDYDAANVAQRIGYQDGLKDGRDAAREGDRYHPQNSGDWQKGTNGYESRFGSKSAYKQAYRSAYVEGYNAGFQRDEGRQVRRERREWRRNF
jgi:hypothetical protein